jgi:hypothetical protein
MQEDAYYRLMEERKKQGWQNPESSIKKHDFLNPESLFRNSVIHIVENSSFGIDKFSLCLLFFIEKREFFQNLYKKHITEYAESNCVTLSPYHYPYVIHEFVQRYGVYPSILSVLGNNFDDLSNNHLICAISQNTISYERGLEILKKNIKTFTATQRHMINENFESVFFTYMNEFDLNDLKKFFERNKKYLSPSFKISYFKRCGIKESIDDMISDDAFEVRLLALQCLDPKDKKILSFTRDKSKIVYDSALKKAHISYVPMFLGSVHLKKCDSKNLFSTRIDNKF